MSKWLSQQKDRKLFFGLIKNLGLRQREKKIVDRATQWIKNEEGRQRTPLQPDRERNPFDSVEKM